MKDINKIISLFLILITTLTSCVKDEEVFILKDNVAPIIREHSAILVTPSSKVEDVTFTWSKARLVSGEMPEYILYGQYSDNAAITFGTTTNLSLTLTKENFNDMIIKAGAPKSDQFDMNFWVIAYYDGGNVESSKVNVKIQSQGDAVEPQLQLQTTDYILSSEIWDNELVFNWDAAVLEYGAEITYTLQLIGETTLNLATTTDLNTVLTVEQLNDKLIEANYPINSVEVCNLQVIAKSNEFPEGVGSALIAINVSAYEAIYPDKFYVPGSHQGWAPDAPDCPVIRQTDVKGIYESFLYLVDKDGGATCQFKFSPNPAWNGDFGLGDDGKLNGSKNIEVESGIYRVVVNYKNKTIETLKVESLGLIGDATPNGWAGQTNLDYDKVTNTWSIKTKMVGGSYKFRLNDSWDWAIGANGIFGGSEPNYDFKKPDGDYKIILNTSVAPYSVNILSLAFPEVLYLPGSHQGWDPASAPQLIGNGEGYYEGYVNLSDKDGGNTCNWKFTSAPNWGGTNYGQDVNVSNGLSTDGGAGNIVLESGYYKVWADLSSLTYGYTKINSLGLIGTFNSWSGDLELTYNPQTNKWSVSNFEVADGDQFKARFDASWSSNLGANVDVEPYTLKTNEAVTVRHDGKNMTAVPGIYTVEIDIASVPYKITLK